MTQKEGAIISAYTGLLLCREFPVFHEYVEKLMGGPVMTHQMGSEKFSEQLKELATEDFTNLIMEQS